MNKIKYKIGEVSKKFSISIRLLRYYDEIELLIPSFRDENGYRYYNNSDIIKLEQILMFQMLDFSLQEIKELLNSGSIIDELKVQKQFIRNKKAYDSFIENYISKVLESDKDDIREVTENIKELYSFTSGQFHEDTEISGSENDSDDHDKLIKLLRRIIDDHFDEEDIYEELIKMIPDLKKLEYLSEFFIFLRLSNSSRFRLDEIDRIEKKLIKFSISLDSDIM
jgi:DNA-binding transcriptional MerR regulator